MIFQPRFPAFVGQAVLVLAAATPAGAQEPWSASPAVGLGPLLLRSQSPFSLLRLSPTPLPPLTVPKNAVLLGGVVNWNNYFDLDPDRYIIDLETLGITLGAAVGLSENVDVNLSVPVSYRGGGVLDGFVEWFESRIGAINEERRRHRRDQFLVRITGPDGEIFERSGQASGWGLEDVTVSLRRQLRRGSATTPAVLAAVMVKLPLGREASLRSTGGHDVGLGLSFGQRLGRFHLYGTAAVMRYTSTRLAGVDLRDTQWSGFLGVEYRRSSRTSYLVQLLVTSPPAHANLGGFSRESYEVTVGVKRVLSSRFLLEASLLENLFIFNNAPDVGFHVGLVWRSAAPAVVPAS